jgi:hypothetical protein
VLLTISMLLYPRAQEMNEKGAHGTELLVVVLDREIEGLVARRRVREDMKTFGTIVIVTTKRSMSSKLVVRLFIRDYVVAGPHQRESS